MKFICKRMRNTIPFYKLSYERDKNKVSACDYKTGRMFSEKELSWIYRNMSFEDFVRYSQNCFLTNLNLN